MYKPPLPAVPALAARCLFGLSLRCRAGAVPHAVHTPPSHPAPATRNPACCLAARPWCRYSEEFERTFMEHLKRAHPFSRIAANVVYNEYINDR